MTHDPTIIEAAVRAMCDAADLSSFWSDGDEAWRVATAIVSAVAPMIRAQVLEEAAKVAEDYYRIAASRWPKPSYLPITDQIAAALRALKEQP